MQLKSGSSSGNNKGLAAADACRNVGPLASDPPLPVFSPACA